LKRRETVATLFCILFLSLVIVLGGCGGDGGSSSGTSGTGGTISLAWDSNTDADLAGYKVYYRTASGVYGVPIDVGMATQSSGTTYYTLTGLTKGETYYIVVTAYDSSVPPDESVHSNEVNGAAK
jgi:hypothetical protein